MKIWNSYGSEHSANLVMIGHFKNADSAEKVKEVFDKIAKAVSDDQQAGTFQIGDRNDRYSREMLDLLSQLQVSNVGPSELEQFIYDINYTVENEDLVITTEEVDISAFLKILISYGARVEVYSAHNYPDKPK